MLSMILFTIFTQNLCAKRNGHQLVSFNTVQIIRLHLNCLHSWHQPHQRNILSRALWHASFYERKRPKVVWVVCRFGCSFQFRFRLVVECSCHNRLCQSIISMKSNVAHSVWDFQFFFCFFCRILLLWFIWVWMGLRRLRQRNFHEYERLNQVRAKRKEKSTKTIFLSILIPQSHSYYDIIFTFLLFYKAVERIFALKPSWAMCCLFVVVVVVVKQFLANICAECGATNKNEVSKHIKKKGRTNDPEFTKRHKHTHTIGDVTKLWMTLTSHFVKLCRFDFGQNARVCAYVCSLIMLLANKRANKMASNGIEW